MGLFDLFKKKKDEFEFIETEINIDSEPLEVFMNESENKCGELYCKNGCYTYKILKNCLMIMKDEYIIIGVRHKQLQVFSIQKKRQLRK